MNGSNSSFLYDLFKTKSNNNELDEVDKILLKRDGLIERKVNYNCRHGPNGRCVSCAPIEPYDEAFLKEHNIKHMSFHSYLKKLQRGVDKGKFVFLEDQSCKIKIKCKEHGPWPEGICTKCQPSAITLNSQTYRHVDNVTFENISIVENFLNYWRTTGHQRVGFLYGYYEPYKEVPLGIKAVVVAIYEPPQESNRDSLKLDFERFNLKDVDFVADFFGYQRIGWIFTDLISEDNQKGTVKTIRDSNSYFLSSHECIMAGLFQNCHSNPCHLSKNKFFGSKFVTVCVTGDKNNHIHMEAYQVSNQCVSLVRDDCLIPTNVPELAYVRESNRERYVPDVFYKGKDEYGNDVVKIARPLPIEYLLVDVPVSAPIEQSYTFNPMIDKKSFPVENRLIEGHLQDLHSLANYCKQFSKEKFFEMFSDFHLLIYLTSFENVNLKEFLPELFGALKSKNHFKVSEWASKDHWATVEQLMLVHSNEFSSLTSSSETSIERTNSTDRSITTWSCQHCTFENEKQNSSCEMCSLPRNNN